MTAEASPIAVPTPATPKVAPTPAKPVPAKPSRRGIASLDIVAEPLIDKVRLGDYLTRQTSEFRAEIDRPVRLDDPIVAHYPVTALRQGREDSVAVWIVVDHTGQAEEVNIIDGAPEFADEVVAAVNAAKFLPAEHKLRPIRYPIALEFRFKLNEPGAVAQRGDTR